MMYRLHTKKNSSANYSRHLSRKFSLTKRRITHWPFKRCLLWTQIRLNAVEVIRLLHNTLTLKEAKVALNTDIYHWTWPHKWLRLTVSPNQMLVTCTSNWAQLLKGRLALSNRWIAIQMISFKKTDYPLHSPLSRNLSSGYHCLSFE